MTREQFINHVEGCQRALRRFLTALCCGDSQLAEDIAQESLIKAYLSCEGFREDARFTTWIYRIAYNTFVTHKRSARPTEELDQAHTAMAPEGADSSFEYQELHAALDGLPPKERTAVLLFYMDSYSTKEIAEITDTSEAAVRQHLSRGRNHLRNILSTYQ
ncbi:MAG: RNA polymerase sigma factor [Bacteroidales bacterium]|nr:RNA polymerase sigma factor [Bacteroidales bacterium]